MSLARPSAARHISLEVLGVGGAGDVGAGLPDLGHPRRRAPRRPRGPGCGQVGRPPARAIGLSEPATGDGELAVACRPPQPATDARPASDQGQGRSRRDAVRPGRRPGTRDRIGHVGRRPPSRRPTGSAATSSTARSLISSAKWHAVRWPASSSSRSCGSSVDAALRVAELLAQPAAGVEAAARRRRGRRRHVALEHEALLAAPRVGLRDRRQQRDRVRVARVAVELLDRADLDDLAEVHDADPVAEVLDDRQVVADEQVGQVEVAAEVEQQVQDLALDRHVERGDRLVADDEVRARARAPGRSRSAAAGRR